MKEWNVHNTLSFSYFFFYFPSSLPINFIFLFIFYFYFFHFPLHPLSSLSTHHHAGAGPPSAASTSFPQLHLPRRTSNEATGVHLLPTHGGGPTRSSPTGHGGCPDVARWPTMEAAPREARPPAIDPPLRRLPLPHLQRGHRRPSSTTHGGRLAQSSPDDQGGSLVKVHLGH
jgi:hypothetical protein